MNSTRLGCTGTYARSFFTLHTFNSPYLICNIFNEKSTQRRRKRCLLAVVRQSPKNFAPLQTPFLGVRDGQNLISWRWSLPLPTNPVWWGSMHTISSYPGNRPTCTQTHTHKPTDRTDYNTLHHSFASAQCNNLFVPLRYFCTKNLTMFVCTERYSSSQCNNEKKCSEEMQTLLAGCSELEPKNFAPLQTPSQGRGMAKI